MSQDETAVNTEVVEQESTVAESAPAETNTPEVAPDEIMSALQDDDDSPKPKEETESEPEEPSEEPEAAEETPEDEPLGDEKPLKPKSENRFQKLANENRALKEYIQQVNQQTYQPQTAEELQQEGLSEESARITALEQQIELDRYNSQVTEAQLGLEQESRQVFEDFPMFNPDSPEFDADIAASAAEVLSQNLITDPNTGQVIGSHVSPYSIYKPIADAYQKAAIRNKVEGQRAAERQFASVDAPHSATPKTSKKDPIMEALTSDD